MLLYLFSFYQLNSISIPLSWQESPSQSLLESLYLPYLHQNLGDVQGSENGVGGETSKLSRTLILFDILTAQP